jgi:hypothetical protein
MYQWKKGLRAAALTAAAIAGVAGQQMAGAQLFVYDPDYKRGPIEGSDPLVGLPLPGATPAEYRRTSSGTCASA